MEASVRQLPPWLKASKPWWIQQHLLALVRRKLLVAEAERRGLSALMPRFATGADRERLLARALLDIELRKEREPVRAKALRQVWERTTDALIADADLRVDERQLFEIEPEKLLGPAPAYTAIEGMPARLEFFSRTGPCVVEVEPALRRYGGVCEGHRKLSEAFLEPETLQIVDLIPGSVVPAGFFAQLHDEFIESRRTRGDLLEAARRAESSMLRSEVRLMESTGTIYQWSATTVLGLAKPALQRCLALALFQARDEPDKATVRIRVELRPDGSTGTRVESTPAIPADACATMLARPEIGGAGVVTFLAELQRRP